MLQYSGRRLEIVMSLENKFDYSQFKIECEKSSIPVLSPHSFAQKVGMLLCGMRENPTLTPKDAYSKFVEDYRDATPIIMPDKKPCGGCGGGQVR